MAAPKSKSTIPLKTPCYAVIFTSTLKPGAGGYDAMAAEMVRGCEHQPGFLGLDSARGPDGAGVTVCYWESEADIARWRADPRHREAQARGRAEWYETYSVAVARVERAYGPEG